MEYILRRVPRTPLVDSVSRLPQVLNVNMIYESYGGNQVHGLRVPRVAAHREVARGSVPQPLVGKSTRCSQRYGRTMRGLLHQLLCAARQRSREKPEGAGAAKRNC